MVLRHMMKRNKNPEASHALHQGTARPRLSRQCSSASRRSDPGSKALIIDHDHTGIEQIPDQWLEQARDLAFHYAHTSHGSQIMSGLQYLASQDPRYAISVDYAGRRPRLLTVHAGLPLRL